MGNWGLDHHGRHIVRRARDGARARTAL